MKPNDELINACPETFNQSFFSTPVATVTDTAHETT